MRTFYTETFTGDSNNVFGYVRAGVFIFRKNENIFTLAHWQQRVTFYQADVDLFVSEYWYISLVTIPKGQKNV